MTDNRDPKETEMLQIVTAGAPSSLPRKAKQVDENAPLILVVEDDPGIQHLTMMFLRSHGYRGHVVANGQLAVDAVQQTTYAAILMDWNMPVMDGVAATREIRALRFELPIIAYTSNVAPEDRDFCIAAGMDDHLPKGCDLKQLRTMLTRWI